VLHVKGIKPKDRSREVYTECNGQLYWSMLATRYCFIVWESKFVEPLIKLSNIQEIIDKG
jgi:hypothetical protein